MGPKNQACWLKLHRAGSHLADLESQLTKWAHSGHHEVFDEPDTGRGSDWRRVRVVTDDVPLDPFSVVIGDILHNLRSTLDHLVYSLSEKHTGSPLPDKLAKDSEFPIFRCPDGKAINRRIRGMHPDAQARIRDLQPYQRPNFALDPLWILQELSNVDKHRLLIIGAVSNRAAGYRPGLSRNAHLLNVEVYNIPIKGEAVVVRYQAAPIDPGKEMHVEFDPLLEIAFDGPEIVKGKGVIETLRSIFGYIETRAFGLLTKFL